MKKSLKSKSVKDTSNNINWKKIAEDHGIKLLFYKRKCKELTLQLSQLQGHIQDLGIEGSYLITKYQEQQEVLEDIERQFNDDDDDDDDNKFKFK